MTTLRATVLMFAIGFISVFGANGAQTQHVSLQAE
jgi:hypothetical protein